jgi:hypothetical protein
MGHEQTSRHVRVMSVIPLKADIHQRGLHVRLKRADHFGLGTVVEEFLIMEIVFRFVVGGLVVSLFAAFGDLLKPKSFAGLFAAAPSVALATLGLTMLTNGPLYAATESRSMIARAVALFLYAFVTLHLIMRYRLHAGLASISALPGWLICALGAWFLVLQ